MAEETGVYKRKFNKLILGSTLDQNYDKHKHGIISNPLHQLVDVPNLIGIECQIGQ